MPDDRIKIIAAWGRKEAIGYGPGEVRADVGWVRARAEDGSVYVYVGRTGHTLQTFPIRAGYNGIVDFRKRVEKWGTIDPQFWKRTSGPEAPETSQAAEYLDANEKE